MNTNPVARRVLCFGDSNTWGYIPGTDHQRYPANVRWTGVLQSLLGDGYEIVEEGLNSRGILKGDDRPGKEGTSSIEYILPCLDSHDPLDYVVVLLGTNELKSGYGLSSQEVGENLRSFLRLVASRHSQSGHSIPEVIVVVPPFIDESTEYCRSHDKYKGASGKSKDLGMIYKGIAVEVGVRLVDIQDELKTGDDGVHLDRESHRILAERLAEEF